MKRFVIPVSLALTLLSTGCATTRECSGRMTTDNGHVIRNEEDCTWGPQYAQSQVQSQPVYVIQQTRYGPQYVQVQPVAPKQESSSILTNVLLLANLVVNLRHQNAHR